MQKNTNNILYQKNGSKPREYCQKYRDDNKDKIKGYARKFRLNNKREITIWRAEYYKNNKKSIRAKHRSYEKMQTRLNSQIAIRRRLRDRVKTAFDHYSKHGKILTSKQYGINYEAIIAYLGPHPNTIGIKGEFHIDHIIPLSSFDLNDPEQIKLAFAPENHQYLKAKENISKKNKIHGQLNLMTQKQIAIIPVVGR